MQTQTVIDKRRATILSAASAALASSLMVAAFAAFAAGESASDRESPIQPIGTAITRPLCVCGYQPPKGATPWPSCISATCTNEAKAYCRMLLRGGEVVSEGRRSRLRPWPASTWQHVHKGRRRTTGPCSGAPNGTTSRPLPSRPRVKKTMREVAAKERDEVAAQNDGRTDCRSAEARARIEGAAGASPTSGGAIVGTCESGAVTAGK